MSHFLLTFLVECFVIKLDQINVSLSSFLLSLSQGLMEGLEFPTEHQLVKSDPIHGWFSCCHPHHIILHGNDTIVQFFSKVYFHAAITMLPARPIFPLLVEKGEGQVDNDLQLTGLHEPTHKQATAKISRIATPLRSYRRIQASFDASTACWYVNYLRVGRWTALAFSSRKADMPLIH